MDSNKIEGLAVNAVENRLYKSNLIEPNIAKKDKNPCWDGIVLYYTDGGKEKKNFFGKCDVQVKGVVAKTENQFQESLKYKVELEDLKNYCITGGVLYFVCLIDPIDIKKIKIYYLPLLPYEIVLIFRQLKNKKQQTKTLEFKCFPEAVNKIEKIVFKFINLSKLQYNTSIDALKNIEEYGNLDKLNSSPKCVLLGDIEDIFTEESYLCQKFSNNVYLPIEKAIVQEIRRSNVPLTIKLDGKTYFEKLTVHQTLHTITVFAGSCIKLIFNDDTNAINIDFSYKGEINEIIIGLGFLASLEKCSVLTLDPVGETEITNIKLNYNAISNDRKFFTRIKNLFKILHIEQHFYIDNLTQEDYKVLSYLCDFFIDHIKLPATKDAKSEIKNISIGTLNIAVVAIVDEFLRIQYFDFFNVKNIKSTQVNVKTLDAIPHKTSIYVQLKKEHFLGFSNVYYKSIVKSVKRINNKVHYECVNTMLLQLLEAYDICHNENMLDSAIVISRWLKEKGKLTAYSINYYQCIRRKRDFSADEIKDIMQLKQTEDNVILAAIAKLLGSKQEYNYYLEKLSEQKRKELTEYPISHLP